MWGNLRVILEPEVWNAFAFTNRCFYYFCLPTVQTPGGVPAVPPVLPSLPPGSHPAAGAVLRSPGGAGRVEPRLRLRPLHPQTRPAARRGPQGQWPHRRMSGESACPSLWLCICEWSEVPLSFLRGKGNEVALTMRSGRRKTRNHYHHCGFLSTAHYLQGLAVWWY